MNIAYTMAPGHGDTDLILQSVARCMIEKGFRPAGTTQINIDHGDAHPCDMDVLVLPDGPTIRISQNLGGSSRGCRLDPNALETAVGWVQGRLAQSEFLVVNKFGKHEAEGRGFRSVIADALEIGMPVLVGLNELNRPAFEGFTGGMARQLSPTKDALVGWLQLCLEDQTQVA